MQQREVGEEGGVIGRLFMLHFERFLFALVWKYITIHPRNVPVWSCQSEQTFAISQKYISAHWHHEGEGCNLSIQQTKGAWSRRQHSLVLSSLANTSLDMITLLCQWWWSHFQNNLHLTFWRKIKCIVWNWKQQFCQFHPLPSHLCNFIYFQVKKNARHANPWHNSLNCGFEEENNVLRVLSLD